MFLHPHPAPLQVAESLGPRGGHVLGLGSACQSELLSHLSFAPTLCVGDDVTDDAMDEHGARSRTCSPDNTPLGRFDLQPPPPIPCSSAWDLDTCNSSCSTWDQEVTLSTASQPAVDSTCTRQRESCTGETVSLPRHAADALLQEVPCLDTMQEVPYLDTAASAMPPALEQHGTDSTHLWDAVTTDLLLAAESHGVHRGFEHSVERMMFGAAGPCLSHNSTSTATAVPEISGSMKPIPQITIHSGATPMHAQQIHSSAATAATIMHTQHTITPGHPIPAGSVKISKSTRAPIRATAKPKPAKKGDELTITCNVCQSVVLSATVKKYLRTRRICGSCATSKSVINKEGKEVRFCQLCSCVHPIQRFDQGRRSCRDHLQKHNIRRQQQKQLRVKQLVHPGAK